MSKLIVIEQDELQQMIEATIRRVIKSEDPLKETASTTEHLTVKQAIVFLDLAKQTIYGLTSRNEIPHYKRGKKLYFLKAELEKWMLENRRVARQKVRVYGKNSS